MLKYLILLMISKIIFTVTIANTQELDTDELLEKIERLEKNVFQIYKKVNLIKSTNLCQQVISQEMRKDLMKMKPIQEPISV